MPGLDDRLRQGQIEILDYSQWYTRTGRFSADDVLNGWLERLDGALKRGHEGLRLTGNTFWLEKSDWGDFRQYEELINRIIGRHPIIALCTYSLQKCGATEIMDVVSNHQFAMVKRQGRWEVIVNGRQRELNEELRRAHQRTASILESTTDAVFQLDRQFRFSYVNRRCAEVFRSPAGQWLGRSLWECFPEARGSTFQREYEKAMATGQSVEFEEYYPPFGQWFEVHAYPSDEGLAVYFRDVTERKRAEQRQEQLLMDVRHRAAELDATFASIAHGLVLYDSSGRKLYSNASADQILKTTSDERAVTALADRVRVFPVTREDGKPFKEDEVPPARALRGETVKDVLMTIHRPEGDIWISSSAAPIRAPGGEILGAAVSFTDVTAQRHADKSLRESREDLKRAQAVAHTGSWRLDVRRNALSWSDETYRIFGIPRGTPMTYELFLRAVHPEDREHVRRNWEEALKGRPYDIEHRIVAEGAVRWIRERAELEFGGDGSLVGGFGTAQDITPFKQAVEALRTSEQRFRLLSGVTERLLQAEDPQAVVNGLCQDVMAHLECHVFFNYVAGDPPGRLRLNSWAGISEEEARRIEWLDHGAAVCGCVARDGERIVAEDILHTEDPRTDLVRSYGVQAYCCHPLMASGKVIGTLSFGTKTRPRLSEEEVAVMKTVADQVAAAMVRLRTMGDLRRVNEQLEQRVGERTRDLAGVVDELREEVRRRERIEVELRSANAQLSARAGQLRDLAAELTLTERRERRRMAGVLHDHLQQLLVGAKFHVSSLGRMGNARVRRATAELDKLMEESIEASRSLSIDLSPPILREGSLASCLEWLACWMEEKHGLTVALVAGKDLLPLAEDVKLLLFESVRELLLNVVKHAGVRSAKVDLRCVGGTAMRITVEDSGRGFDPAIPRKVGAPGGGLGIFGITERLDLIGGQMQIESAPGQGSRFILTVPTRTAAAPAAGSETRSLPLGERSRREARPAEGFRVRVLLADDHAVMREGLAGLLGQESGIEVVGQASDGQAAIELARRLMPDVILMDLAMPGINGVEATRIIHGEMPWMKIVGLSMHDEPERSKVMREAGAAGYLTKSSDPQDIIRAVRECGIADVPRLPAGVRAARPRAKRAPRK